MNWNDKEEVGREFTRKLVEIGKIKMHIEDRYDAFLTQDCRWEPPGKHIPWTEEKKKTSAAICAAYYAREVMYKLRLHELQEEFYGRRV